MQLVGFLSRFLRYIEFFWFWIVPKIFGFINYFKQRARLPLIDNEVLLLSATNLATKIRNRELSSEYIVRCYVERCQTVNPIINAIVEDNFENAIAEAKNVDKQIANGSAPSFEHAPFLGVPFSVKNCVLVDGMNCSVGMECRRDKLATEDAVVVANMKRAGAIPLVVTNVGEACMWWETFNFLHGRTNNPYDNRRSVGGSSGGEGALIGAAGSVFGVGTDAAGSVRIPCCFNGIFGHKPTADIVDTKGAHAHVRTHRSALFVVGPMCRYAEDLLPMLAVLAGPRRDRFLANRSVDFTKLKIFYMYDIDTRCSSPVQKQIKIAMRKVMSYFSLKYDTLRFKLNLSYMHYSLPILLQALADPDQPTFTEIVCHCQSELRPLVEFLKYLVGCPGSHTFAVCCLALLESLKAYSTPSKYEEQALARMRETLIRQFDELLSENAVFIFPPMPRTAPYHKQSMFTPLDCIYSSFLNPLGLPATSCPLGIDDNGMPLGVQIIGAKNRDCLTIAVAAELEKIFGGWTEPGCLPYPE